MGLGLSTLGDALATAGDAAEATKDAAARDVTRSEQVKNAAAQDIVRSEAVKDVATNDMRRRAMERADTEAQRVANEALEFKKVTADSWEEAKRAASIRNAVVAPPVVLSPGVDDPVSGYSPEVTARGVAPKVSTEDLWRKEFMPRIYDQYMKNGQPDKAEALQAWADGVQGRRYTNDYHNAMKSVVMGDVDGGLERIERLYNASVPDGNYMSLQNLGDGNVRVTIRTAQGKTITNQRSLSDFQQAVAMNLSPEQYAAKYADYLKTMGIEGSKAQTKLRTDIIIENLKADRSMEKMEREQSLKLINSLQEHFGKAQLDVMLGKDFKFYPERSPGGGNYAEWGGTIYKIGNEGGKDTFTIVPNQPGTRQRLETMNINGIPLGQMFGPQGGVQQQGANGAPQGAPATPAPAVPQVFPVGDKQYQMTPPMARNLAKLRANDTPEDRKAFDELYKSPGLAARLMGAAATSISRPAAAAPAAPAAAPAAPVTTAQPAPATPAAPVTPVAPAAAKAPVRAPAPVAPVAPAIAPAAPAPAAGLRVEGGMEGGLYALQKYAPKPAVTKWSPRGPVITPADSDHDAYQKMSPPQQIAYLIKKRNAALAP